MWPSKPLVRANTRRSLSRRTRSRAGIEGTLSRGIRTLSSCGGRAISVWPVSHLGHVLTAVAFNFLRLGEWFADVPRAKTRTSAFALLMADSIAA